MTRGANLGEQHQPATPTQHSEHPAKASAVATAAQVDLACVLIRFVKVAPTLTRLVLSARPVGADLWEQVADLSTTVGVLCRREAAAARRAVRMRIEAQR